MQWNPSFLWLLVALLLGLAELTSGGLVLLALAGAAVLTALLAFFGAPLPWQLIGMGIFSGVLVPLTIRVIKPYFTPRGVAYGTTGTGVEKGRSFYTVTRDYDGASGIKINGDFYRVRVDGNERTVLPEGTEVRFKAFEGTTAIVQPAELQQTE